ncbi:MAG: hypothetical protein ACREV1_05935 [Gammaproteobacteria bacterium]
MSKQRMSSVLVLAAAGVLSSVSPAQANDYKVTIRCVNPSLFSTGEVFVRVEDQNGNFQDDTALNCDSIDRTESVVMTDTDADTSVFEIFTDAFNFATGTQNDCDIEADADSGNQAIIRKHLDRCYNSSSKSRYVEVQVVELP